MSRHVIFFAVFLSFIVILRLVFFYTTKPVLQDKQYVNFQTIVATDPSILTSTQSFSIKTATGDTVFIIAKTNPQWFYGDRINASGNIKVKLLNEKTKIYTLSFPKIGLVKTRENSNLAVVYSIRQKIINVFQSSLEQDSSALMLGIVFGIKQGFSKNFVSELKISGVMHIIAASGMNVTMVSAFVFYLFSSFLKRQVAVFLSIFAVLFYASLAGFEASIMRASVMGIIVFSSQILGRQQQGFYALFLRALLMLFLFPQFLFDIGFQLSFAATLGILYIPGVFKSFQTPLSDDFLTTFSAQVATLPILLANFGTYSVWSIVVNVLVLWTVPILMILGGLAAIASFVFEPLSKLILYLCIPLLLYFQNIVDYFSKLPGGINLSSFPWQFEVSYYLIIISLLTLKFKKSKPN